MFPSLTLQLEHLALEHRVGFDRLHVLRFLPLDPSLQIIHLTSQVVHLSLLKSHLASDFDFFLLCARYSPQECSLEF